MSSGCLLSPKPLRRICLHLLGAGVIKLEGQTFSPQGILYRLKIIGDGRATRRHAFLGEQVDHGVVWNSNSFNIGECCLGDEGEADARGTVQCVGGQRYGDADGGNDHRNKATMLTEVTMLGLTYSDWAAGSYLWTAQHLIEGTLFRHVESCV